MSHILFGQCRVLSRHARMHHRFVHQSPSRAVNFPLLYFTTKLGGCSPYSLGANRTGYRVAIALLLVKKPTVDIFARVPQAAADSDAVLPSLV